MDTETTGPHPVSPHEPPPADRGYEAAARVFRALGHPLRVKIVCGLLGNPATQTQIAASLGLPQSSATQHVNVLRQNGIVEGSRNGTEVFLRITDRRIPGLLQAVGSAEASTPIFDWGNPPAKD
jgi:ArsR family transcriptional regulator